MKILCTICARGGSKGVLNKNLREILGKPLIAHTIAHAKAAEIFQYIAVSSDSAEIREKALLYGADLVVERPDELATDTAAKLPAIQHCAREVERIKGEQFDIFVDLDATSPLRIPKDITNAVKTLLDSKGDNVITACPSRRSPYFNMVEVGADGFVHLSKDTGGAFVRRQDVPRAFDMNASIYCWKRDSLLNGQKVLNERTVLYEMPEVRSHDIDSELDFEIVKMILEKGYNLER